MKIDRMLLVFVLIVLVVPIIYLFKSSQADSQPSEEELLGI